MTVFEEIRKRLENDDIVNVVIAGMTCSGKSTLADEIRKRFSSQYSVTVVAQDDYFKNLSYVPRSKNGYLMDSINAFHTREFQYDVQKLVENGVVVMPVYDIATNSRLTKKRIVRTGQINVFEGLHTIRLLENLDKSIKIFVDTDIDTCLQRRIARDASKYGIPESRIREYWEKCVKPMYDTYIFPQRKDADIIIKCEGGEFSEC